MNGATPPGSGRIHNALLIMWVALIAADRIDLMGGDGPLLVTPFLALTPIVVLSELVRRTRRRRAVALPRAGMHYAALALALLGVALASVFVSPETSVSAGRATLLALQIVGTFAAVIVAIDRDDWARVMERGAVVGLILFGVFDVLQIAWLLGWVPEYARLGPASVHLVSYMYGAFIPRLSGMVADQNRAGLVLLFFGWILATRPGLPPRRGYLAFTVVLMLLTLSRSVGVAALATFIILVLERRIRRVSPGLVLGALLVVAGTTAAILVSPGMREGAGTALQPLGDRFSVEEGSSQIHLVLIERGIQEATASPARVALGIGYGSSYTVLEDIFPGNRYGNFHSLYVTIFAESGVFALLLLLALLVTPLVRGGPYRALVAGVAVFNIFYQATNDPAFWVILTLAWLTMPVAPRRPRSVIAEATGGSG